MRRTTSAGAVAAAVVLLAGCSAPVSGTAAVGSQPVTSSSTSRSSTSPSTTRSTPRTSTSTSEDTSTTTDTTTTDTTSTTDDTATSPVADLDPVTQAWFIAFCGRASDVAQYISPNTNGQTLAQAQATVVDAYRNISTSAATSAGLLQAVPAPAVPGGADLQAKAIESFTAVSDVYGRGAATIAALTPTGVDDLKSAIDAVEAEATASVPNTMTDVDPDVLAAAKQLPDCQDVLGG